MLARGYTSSTLIINATTLKAAPPVIPRALVFFELELELELELFKFNRYRVQPVCPGSPRCLFTGYNLDL